MAAAECSRMRRVVNGKESRKGLSGHWKDGLYCPKEVTPMAECGAEEGYDLTASGQDPSGCHAENRGEQSVHGCLNEDCHCVEHSALPTPPVPRLPGPLTARIMQRVPPSQSLPTLVHPSWCPIP